MNYEIFEFEDYNSMDDFKVSNLYEDGILIRRLGYMNKEEIIIKVWKKGIITDLDNKKIKTYASTWKYNQIKRKDYFDRRKKVIEDSFVDVKKIIWNVYKKYYPLKSSIVYITDTNRHDFYNNQFLFIDNNHLNISLNNIKLCKDTVYGMEVFPNHNNYFELDLDIPNDIDEYININEPVILDEYPDLEIYKNGIVIDRRGVSRILVNNNGYKTITYKGKRLFVHRLVGLSFLRNKYSYPFVNHINGDRGDNRVENLEWTNNTLNTLHGDLKNPRRSWNNLDSYSLEISINKPPFRVCLTSKNYKEFVRRKIYQELDMDVKYWLFSNSEPFFIFYIPYRKSVKYFKFRDLLNPVLNKFHKVDKGILNGLSVKKQRSILIDLINRFFVPKNSSDHIINLLKLLDIDFDTYFDWLFDDLKKLVNDDVGFIYFKEFHRYYQIVKMSDKVVYEINIESHMSDKYRDRKSFKDSKTFQNQWNRYFNVCINDRVVEMIDHINIPKNNEKRCKNDYFYKSFFLFFEEESDFRAMNEIYGDRIGGIL